ncbi:MAG: MBL fold metallo-hydrolase [Oscillospiraceae bacterium]|jgi:glyoxylase-like metal-dependent hydrolase (beta-lactamase superfamily II)|nr:MBL fold metallo-hydrolase [Oscillospiraceae bacterium]
MTTAYQVKTLEVGPLQTNCYVVTDLAAKECAIIDPGAESAVILEYIAWAGLSPKAIFITHAHFDHVTALPEVARETGAQVYVCELETAGDSRDAKKLAACENLSFYKEGDVITVGGLRFEVLQTPGHTAGSVSLLCSAPGSGDTDCLFSGDTLFAGSCGRTDLGGSMPDMLESLLRLSALPPETEVYPGHGESSDIGRENAGNYYIRYAKSGFPAQSMEF